MKIAYLVNQYPHVSHSFVRREIAALEHHGIGVLRFSLRRSAVGVVDEADRAEARRTRVVLDAGVSALFSAVVREACRRPGSMLQAASLALTMGWRSDSGVLRHFAYLAEACVLRRWFVDGDVDHLHAHFGTNAATVALLCRVLGGPSYSFTVHGSEEFARAPHLALATKIERAAFVVTVCDYGRRELMRWCRRGLWPRIHVVRCGLDEAFFRETLTAVPDVRRLICVGRLCEEKAQMALLDAVSRLAAAGEVFEMVFVGDGPLRGNVDARIAALGLTACVTVTGWLSSNEVRREIMASRALVVSSIAECMPVVLMEALALGRPVVSSALGGIPELVEAGCCGWLVSPGSTDALDSALLDVLRTPVAELTGMGRIGAQRVARWHNAAVEAAKLAALFAGSIENASASTPPQ